MPFLLAVAAGGAFGALARYWLMSLVDTGSFPWGTLVVNISGSLVMGLLYVLIGEKMLLTQEMRALLAVGFTGAFTTFSTFALDALSLLQQGQLLPALAYVFSSVLLCILAAWLGMSAARMI